MDFIACIARWAALFLVVFWALLILINVITIRKELEEVIIILNGCGCEEILPVSEAQILEDYVPAVESLA